MIATTKWLKSRKVLSDEDLAELYHRIQLQELPMICYKSNDKWVLCLDQREAGIKAKDGFIIRKGFHDSAYLIKWARTQFGTGVDVNIQWLGPLTLSS